MEKPTAIDDFFFIPADYFRRQRREEIFPGAADHPLEVDLGSGDGTFLVEMAAHYPERNFLAVERLLGRARKICRKAMRRRLTNVKVLRLESAYTVEWLLPEHSVSRLHLLFPDPWPKKRHHRRRLVTQEFLRGVAGVLQPGGEFLFRTDDWHYYQAVQGEIERCGFFAGLDWLGEEEFYPESDFERQWRAAGRPVHASRWKPGEAVSGH